MKRCCWINLDGVVLAPRIDIRSKYPTNPIVGRENYTMITNFQVLKSEQMSTDTSNFVFLSREETENILRTKTEPHYVYVLGTPEGRPFYVGKGSNGRVFQHEADAWNANRPSHKRNLIRKIVRTGGAIGYRFAEFYADEIAALRAETRLIAAIGRHDLGEGPLTNQTDGGEGTSNPSLESRLRRLASLGGESDDPERRVINKYFADISGPQSSVPIKPLATWRNARQLQWTARKYGPTLRSARAIIATAASNGVVLSPGAILSRVLVLDGIEYLIENGCGDALIKSGMVRLINPGRPPREEELELTHLGFDYVRGQIGDKKLIDLGILEP